MKKFLKFGPLFIIITALLWSFDGVLRISLYSLPPSVVVFYEHLLGAIILLFLLPQWFGDLKKMQRKEWMAIIIVALFSGALGTILYTAALRQVNYSQYSVVVLLQQLQPIWAICMAAILLKEKLTKRFVVWAVVALVAVYFVSFRDLRVNWATGSGTIIAAGLALGAGLVWGASTAISKYVLNKVHFLTAVSLRFFLTPVFAFIFIASLGQTSSLTALTAANWVVLGMITCSTGLVALAFYYYGLKLTPARVTTLCELVWPASAIFIDYFLYHKTLSITQIIGVAVLLFAIYKITKPLAKENQEPLVVVGVPS